ncbi:MAG: prolipoprotein diacylglyceryl transferase [Verrucomicrobium sp.]|nr:prolipoprotein diacylglyceryl transferase family protein [Verrucomicrobium sp.]
MHWSNTLTASGPYRWTLLGGILLSACYWWIRSRKNPAMLPVYVGALGGAFLGAKVLYLLAEGWQDWQMPDRWFRLATGKTVLGGLLGGYAGVEILKSLIGYKKSTGDAFALIAPLGIALGRVGCVMQGCCLGLPTNNRLLAVRDAVGVARWPSALIELIFQMGMFAVLLGLRQRPAWQGRLFFLYLVCYGGFRFVHEWMRDTPKLVFGLSGYQFAALLMVGLGAIMMQRRKKHPVM